MSLNALNVLILPNTIIRYKVYTWVIAAKDVTTGDAIQILGN